MREKVFMHKTVVYRRRKVHLEDGDGCQGMSVALRYKENVKCTWKLNWKKEVFDSITTE